MSTPAIRRDPTVCQARRVASAAGLQVTPLWTASDSGIVDLDVDRPGAGEEGDAQA
jgi:hypothetical protein